MCHLYGHLLACLLGCLTLLSLHVSTLNCIIMTVQVHEICRLLSIVCHGKRQLLLSVANRIASFAIATTKEGTEEKTKMETLTEATSSYKRITKQMVFIVCRFIVYRICQPTNSLFRKPYNEINSDKIYVVNATENRWQCDDGGDGGTKKKARMKGESERASGSAEAKIKTSCFYCVGFLR